MPRSEAALCDAGPLVALFDARDSAHETCQSALKSWAGQLITTWPVLTEAFHFLDRAGPGEFLWEFILNGAAQPVDLLPDDWQRMRALMRQYSNMPMDLADASVVALAERLNVRQIFTLDRHFRLYRPRHYRGFDVFP